MGSAFAVDGDLRVASPMSLWRENYDRTSWQEFQMVEIDGYTDLEVIGQGGFAIVYKARQVSVGRDVAIKLLTDPSPDHDLVRRFRRESQAVGALSWHPHIAAVVDAGATTGGQAYIVFELLAGGSLEDRLLQSPMHWTEAVAAMIQVADAVEAAHRSNVLHRDIKPANILLDRLGVAKLGDFGIASMQDGDKTKTGMLATTVAHAAPELFNGEPASAATDVYALGSTLHTLLSGVAPFAPAEGDQIARTISRIITDAPPRLDPHIVPDEITTVVAHALAKQPQYRPRSAGAIGQALQEAQHQLAIPVTAMPVTDAEPVTTMPPPSTAPGAAAIADPIPPDALPAAEASPLVPHATTSTAPPDEAHTRHVPFVNPEGPAQVERTRLRGLIGVLSVVAVLLAAAVAGLVIFQLRQGPETIAVTSGGAQIRSFEALAVTTMPAPHGEANAIDQLPSTYWGVTAAADGTRIQGTSYVIGLTDEQLVTRVGISHGDSIAFGRVESVVWGTRLIDGRLVGSTIDQELPDAPGEYRVDYNMRTSQVVVVITGVHDDADAVGIAEILIEVEETDTP